MLVALSLLCASGWAPAGAEDLTLTRGGTIVIDGRGADRAWEQALALPVAGVDVPVPGTDEQATLTARVRLTESEGRLCVLVEVDEDPGPGMGLVLLVAQRDAKTAADATSIAYRPQSVRQLRYICRGPAGVGRATYPVEGAAVATERGRWSVELAVGLDAIRPPDGAAPLRVAALVLTRSPNVTSAAPPEAAFHGPAAWAVVAPPDGGWGAGARFDAAALAREDAVDVRRFQAWMDFLRANAQMNLEPPAGGEETQLRAVIDEVLLAPLETIRELRPELGPRVDVLEADVFRQIGRIDEAATRYARAIQTAPGLREARFGQAFFVDLARWTGTRTGAGPLAVPYAQAMELVQAVEREAGIDVYRRDAAAAAHGMLLYKSGRLAEAVKRLEPLALRYPMHRVLNMTLSHAREGVLPWATELQRRKRDAKLDLPRVRLTTTRGEVDVELFQDDAPNAVNNFVWLARKKFFDDTAWHVSVPYFMVQGGDPFSKDPEQESLVGLGGPGYAIRAEANDRLPFRGTLAMVQTGVGTAGSQFVLLTGTALHAKDRVMVFGRVVAGQNVADRLAVGDRLVQVEMLRTTDGWDYTPRNVAQEAPREPKATAPPAPGTR